jgi:hypothetical protein
MKLKHYLIASAENNYQPWILGKTAMVCFVLSVWALRLFLPGYLAYSAPGLDNQDLIGRINAERTQRFLPALTTNSMLMAAASIKSDDMLERNYFAHVNPDGDYIWPAIEAQGYKPYQSLGENLAMDFSTAEAVVNAWMNSPGHRANILSEKFEDQGMSAVYGEFEAGHDTYVITNTFGSLLKKVSSSQAQPAAKPTPPPPAPVPSQDDSPSAVAAAAAGQPSEPIPPPAPVPPPPPAAAPISTTEQQPLPALPQESSGAKGEADMIFLKIAIGLFAAAYTIFLVIDSLLIHRAQVRRENLASSPHSLMMIMVSLTNFLTLWL